MRGGRNDRRVRLSTAWRCLLETRGRMQACVQLTMVTSMCASGPGLELVTDYHCFLYVSSEFFIISPHYFCDFKY